MRHGMRWVALVGLSVLCAACPAPWQPETIDNLHAIIERMHTDGAVSQEQAVALKQVVDEAGNGTTWRDALELIGTMLGSTVFALLGVQRMRGPAARLDVQSIAALRSMLASKPDAQG